MSDAITMNETPRSRRWVLGPRNQVRLEYLLEGTADDLALCQHVRDNSPLFYGGCLRTEINLDPETVDEVNDRGRWTATVQYEELVGVIGFEGGESTAHLTQSIQTVHKYAPAGQTAPDFKGAIGVNGTDVDGVDVPAPTWDFQLSVIRTADDVDAGYLATFRAAQGKVNSVAYNIYAPGVSWTFAAGELLLRRVTAQQRGKDSWEITGHFSASENATNIAVGDITVSAKWGWEYLWVLYQGDVDAVANQYVKKPLAAYVEQVFRTAVFPPLACSQAPS
jgi:hypothetical protein